MYAITYTKTSLKDIPKLQAAHLDEKQSKSFLCGPTMKELYNSFL